MTAVFQMCLLIVAVLLALLAGFGVPARRVNLHALAFAAFVLAILLTPLTAVLAT